MVSLNVHACDKNTGVPPCMHIVIHITMHDHRAMPGYYKHMHMAWCMIV